MQLDKQNLIWIDLEMTGLNPNQDRILEIATIVTDKNLTILAEGPVLAIHQSESVLATMNEWCIKIHSANGLVERVRQSRLTERAAELQTLDFLKKYVPKGVSPICGNSIAQDKRFLFNYMPELADYFHYRYLDVSTLKELATRWKPEILSGFTKQNTHLALDDIRESITELAYYRQHFLQL
ncbi:oligoribonuclease [Mergibacter septicus]|uniref:oligoribonuclease n=1 Tax=Mergibacter septicus TaxID=221402 RepID=UPI001179368D|nr:oligoribonuclease [Mergibacter septicus]AWX13520.1 oligoribonuclease [Mergibacter septicus]